MAKIVVKTFLVVDHSGRGIKVKIPLSEFAERGWDLTYSNNPDDEDEPTLGDWLADAKLGDEYNHEDEVCTITCIDLGE